VGQGAARGPPPRTGGLGRAPPSFVRHAEDPGYAEQILALVDPPPSFSVLDVGCGPGTLAVPFARRVARVTALDFSPAMLALLGERCRAEGIANVTPVLGSWQDDWDALGIGAHDLALASRSLAVEDLGGALAKLDARARRLACLCTAVGDGPRDRRVFEAVGRPFQPPPDYLVVYGRLHEMGICADVALLDREEWRVFASPEAAAASMAGTVWGLSADEEAGLLAWLRRSLTPCPGGLRLPEPRIVRWAVIWWRKGGPRAPGGWSRPNQPGPEEDGS
jgi:SAM-dependent methyltransferase